MQGTTGSALLRVYRTSELISLKSFTRGFASMSKDVLTGLNITKGGSDPLLKSDEEYPEWLWKLAQPERTLADLKRKENSSLEFEELQRLQKLTNRDRIRTRNVSKSK